MPESRFLKLYPPHDCQECGFTHFYAPSLWAVRGKTKEGKPNQVALVPFEVLGVVEGEAHPGAGLGPLDKPVHIYGLLWGNPGSREVVYHSLIYQN